MRYKELLTTSRKGGLNGRYRKKNGRVLAGSTSIGPICILHDEDDLNVGDGDPYIPGKQSRKGLALTLGSLGISLASDPKNDPHQTRTEKRGQKHTATVAEWMVLGIQTIP